MIAPLVLIALAAVAVPIYFIVRFLRAYERRSAPSPELVGSEARIKSLEAQVERLTADVERLEESQQFTTQLLEQRRVPLPQTAP